MSKNQIIWTALPNGVSTDTTGKAYPQMSVYVSLRLAPDGQQQPQSLGTLPHVFKNWPDAVRGLNFGVELDTEAAIDATLINPKALNPGLWRAVFTPDTAVNSFRFTDLSRREVISSPSYQLLQYLQNHYLAVFEKWPDHLPPGTGLKQFDPASRLSGILANPNSGLAGVLKGILQTDTFAGVARRGDVASIERALVAVQESIRASQDSGRNAPFELHELQQAEGALTNLRLFAQTFRFLAPYRTNGDPPRPKLPDFDFHRLLAIVSQYPSILRALGLVIDLQLAESIPANSKSSKLRLVLSGGWADVDSVMPWTNVDAKSFKPAPRDMESSKPTPRDGAQADFLPLGNQEYDIIELDVHGAAVKFAQTMQAIPTAKPKTSGDSGTSEDRPQGLPSLRTGGLSVAWSGTEPAYPEGSFRAQNFKNRMKSQTALQEALHKGMELPELYAEDLVRGYLVDVFDLDGANAWRSLCKRTITCTVGKLQFLQVDEEGAVTTSVTQSVDPSSLDPLRLPETMFRWNGENLAIPLGQPNPGSESLPGKLKIALQPCTDPPSLPSPPYLPSLRFGHTYMVRMRKVDLAGNSVPADTPLTDPNFYLKRGFTRLEPVNPPVLVPMQPAQPGESIERLVVRSGSDDPKNDLELCARIVMPPETSLLMTDRHGMSDGLNDLMELRKEWIQSKLPTSKGTTAHTKGELFQQMIPKDFPAQPDFLSDPMAFGMLCRCVIDGPDPKPKSLEVPFKNASPFAGSPDWPLTPFLFGVRASTGTATADLMPALDKKGELVLDLPPGEVRRFWLSSIIAPTHLPFFEVYRWLQKTDATGAAAKLAQSGVCWLLMPYREITVVHAVQKPLTAPRFQSFQMVPQSQAAGDTFVHLIGLLQVDAKSTAKVEIQAQWQEFIDNPDDLTTDPTIGRLKSAGVYHSHIELPKNVGLPPKTQPAQNSVKFGSLELGDNSDVVQAFGDTKHRYVSYTAIATSRFTEYFPDQSIDFTRHSDPQRVHVLSTARPAAPKVLYVVPAFRWLSSSDGVSSTREGGWLRIYLDRPWYSSGEGEKLGVVLGQQPLAQPPMEQQKLVTFWGSDPVWPADEPPANPIPFLSGLKDFSDVQLEEGAAVTVKLYDVQWDSSRKLWFCDVQVDVSSTYFPFVRLALVRFQENSLSVKGGPDLRVSRVVLTEPLQVFPTRTLSVDPEQSDTSPGQIALVITVEGKTHKSGIANTFEVHVETTQTGTAPSGDFDWMQIGPDAQGGPSPNSDQLWTGFWAGVPTVPGQSAIPLRVVVKEMEHYSQPSWSPNQPVVTSSRIVYADAFQI